MPGPIAILAKALLFAVLAAVLWFVALQVATVRLTLIADGAVRQIAVSPDNSTYREEIERAKNRALPIYGVSVVAGLIALMLFRKSARVYLRSRSELRRV